MDSYRLLDATLLPRSRKRSEAVDALTLLCDKCPVRQQCREYGIATKSWGIWGGVELQNGEIPRHRRPARDQDTTDTTSPSSDHTRSAA